MNKKQAYALGYTLALLEKQYEVEITQVNSLEFDRWKISLAFQDGQNAIYGSHSEFYWETELPTSGSVYRVKDPGYDPDKERWARYDMEMGWTKSTDDRSFLDRPTLPFIEGRWPWKEE